MKTSPNPSIPLWLLRHLAVLDAIDPGLLSDVINAPDDRLPIIAAALAIASENPRVECDETLASHVRKSNRRRLLEYCASGHVPDGLYSLLSKAAPAIRSSSFYITLLKWLQAKPTWPKLKALHHAENFTLTTLAVLDHLDPVAIHANTLAFVPNIYNARILNAQIAFVRACCPDVTEKEIGSQVRRLGSAYKKAWNDFREDGYFDKPNQLVSLFINRIKFPRAPIHAQNNVVLLDTPKKMTAASVRYRNCLREKIMDVARGERYYFIWQSSDQDVVVELRIEPPIGVRLNDMKAAGNSDVVPSVREDIVNFLETQKIPDLPSWEDYLLEDLDSHYGEEFLKSWEQLRTDGHAELCQQL
ncbi:hypothetical protein [Pseudorhizobium banfieldiae]|nr:hypothetical protein [Pseudorhizobium banfieldiae]CAD6596241.1 hypothetical protein RNT25_00244 [arsenite-oxidising bacterium NT-25]